MRNNSSKNLFSTSSIQGWSMAPLIKPGHRLLINFKPKNYKLSDIVEFGPNLSIKTAWSTNAIAIIKKSCVDCFTRIEKSFRTIDEEYFELKYDKMTQTIYKNPLVSFDAIENNIQSYQQSILYEYPIPINPGDIRHYNDIYQLG